VDHSTLRGDGKSKQIGLLPLTKSAVNVRVGGRQEILSRVLRVDHVPVITMGAWRP
jgi:hypothetical protein